MDQVLVIFLGVIAVVIALISRDVLIRNQELRSEERIAKTGYYRAIGARGLEKRWGKKEDEEEEREPVVGSWVNELFTLAGIPIDALFQDEMPAELQAFIPTVKGFIDGAGGPDRAMQKVKEFLGSGGPEMGGPYL